ncbi:MAG: arginase, partial [Acidobacteriota bacterium]
MVNRKKRLGGVRIIGVPMDLGAGRRGVDMGPSAIRIGRLHHKLRAMEVDVEDSGNLEVKVAEEVPCGEKEQMYLAEIGQVCSRLASKVKQSLAQGRRPLVLGGDHSIAAGSVGGTASYFKDQDEKIGLLWMDAHADMNLPETSPSGNVHGMPLAALLGLGPEALSRIEGFSPKVSPENTVIIGVRSIDREELRTIERSGLRVVSMKELDMRGMPSVMEEALERVCTGTTGFHCSFDLDVVDPRVAPGVGTPVQGGITYRESHLAMEMIYDSRKCHSIEFVEVNPVLDVGNSTGLLAVELIGSALGREIL